MNFAPIIPALLAIPMLGAVARVAWATGHCGVWGACCAGALAIGVGLVVWLRRGRARAQ